MGFDIEIAPSARKSLKSLDAGARNRINAKIELLRDWPNPQADATKLKNRLNAWRVRAGDYRVLFSVHTKERTIYIRRIAHRRDIYLH